MWFRQFWIMQWRTFYWRKFSFVKVALKRYSIACSVLSHTRSSRQEVFCEKGVLRNFIKFTGKHLCQSLFFNKVVDLRPATCNFIKKETLAQMFSFEFCEISKKTFFYRTPLLAASSTLIISFIAVLSRRRCVSKNFSESL